MKNLIIAALLLATTHAMAGTQYVYVPTPMPVGASPCFVTVGTHLINVNFISRVAKHIYKDNTITIYIAGDDSVAMTMAPGKTVEQSIADFHKYIQAKCPR
jgi:Na+-transporting NADH:ubiquinone oxidoreductase subunit NqrF